VTNFAGGGVYTYFRYIDSQHQPCPGNTYTKDHTPVCQKSQNSKSTANGHCVQQSADGSAGTADMV